MQASVLRIAQKVVDLGGKVALQVVVSVTATVCVATITNAYLRRDVAMDVPAGPPVATLDAHAAAGLLNANFTTEAFRPRGASPAEFAAVFGPDGGHAATVAAGAEWPVVAQTEESAGPVRTKPAAVLACADPCNRFSGIDVLPPARPAADAPVQVAQASAAESGDAGKGRLYLLGVPLPTFVPSGERIVTAMTSFGDSITGLVLK